MVPVNHFLLFYPACGGLRGHILACGLLHAQCHAPRGGVCVVAWQLLAFSRTDSTNLDGLSEQCCVTRRDHFFY